MKKTSKLLTALTSLLLAVALVTGSVAVVILWRGFYYGQIEALALPARTGFSPEVIREAFDCVMDYLVKDAPFSTGQLAWSADGRAHFADCRVLFWLDFMALGASVLLLVFIALLVWQTRRKLGRPCLWAFVGLLAVLAVFGGWACIDFDSLFTVFHSVCFPGKTNWIFNAQTDQIILILPEAFWLRAAALVAGLTLGGGALLALGETLLLRRKKPSVYESLKNLK